jgi:hypothetical protein
MIVLFPHALGVNPACYVAFATSSKRFFYFCPLYPKLPQSLCLTL